MLVEVQMLVWRLKYSSCKQIGASPLSTNTLPWVPHHWGSDGTNCINRCTVEHQDSSNVICNVRLIQQQCFNLQLLPLWNGSLNELEKVYICPATSDTWYLPWSKGEFQGRMIWKTEDSHKIVSFHSINYSIPKLFSVSAERVRNSIKWRDIQCFICDYFQSTPNLVHLSCPFEPELTDGWIIHTGGLQHTQTRDKVERQDYPVQHGDCLFLIPEERSQSTESEDIPRPHWPSQCWWWGGPLCRCPPQRAAWGIVLTHSKQLWGIETS